MDVEENNNDPIFQYLLRIEKRLSRLEGEVKVILVMLSVIGGLLIAVFTKI